MAAVAKWLRQRIVAPLCAGSNPVGRPSYELPISQILLRIATNPARLGSAIQWMTITGHLIGRRGVTPGS